MKNNITIIILVIIFFSCSNDSDEQVISTPTLTTSVATSITQTGATSGGNITSNGGADITSRGVVWSTSQNPTISLTTKTSDGSGVGSFSSSLTNLIAGTTYFVRAYATNSEGTAYGNEISFTTGNVQLPIVSTTEITNISQTTANSGGNVTSDGGGTITARGVVWSTIQNPTVALTTKTTDGTSVGNFISNITGLIANTQYYVRSYATNNAGTSYGNEITFTTLASLPTLTTTAISGIQNNSSLSGGNITSDGGSNVTVRGVVWSTSQNPTIALTTKTNNGSGIGTFTSNLSGLNPNTQYYVRSYATNNVGTAYGNEISFTTTNVNYASMYPTGTVFCNNVVTAVVNVINPTTGKTWMDRNLGASQVATSSADAQSYGDLYQWGRRADGHQCRNSATTATLSSTNQPSFGAFIFAPNPPFDWRSPQNINLWQGVNGVNNPCPSGYRLPTETELNAERLSWSSNNATGAFGSPLKLPLAGNRDWSNGILSGLGTVGWYWSSSVSNTNSRFLAIESGNASIAPIYRAIGFSVRCLKD